MLLSSAVLLALSAQLAPTLSSSLPAAPAEVPADDEAARRRELIERHGAEPSEAETDNGISARVLAGATAVDHGQALFGLGVAYERDVAHGLLAVEVALEGLTSADASAVLVELVLEKPIELSDGVGLYFGGGPTLAWHIPAASHRPQMGWGGLALIGTEFEIGGGFEVFVELDVALLLLDDPELEADVGTGVMYRF